MTGIVVTDITRFPLHSVLNMPEWDTVPYRVLFTFIMATITPKMLHCNLVPFRNLLIALRHQYVLLALFKANDYLMLHTLVKWIRRILYKYFVALMLVTMAYTLIHI